MLRMIMSAVIGLLLVLSGAERAVAADGSDSRPVTPKPGTYDYLTLVLGWSPTFCQSSSGHADREQCGSTVKYGFVAHGLWPIFARGSGSTAHGCGSENATLSDKAGEKVSGIMPSRKLINHEWLKHGTCYGGDATAYFSKVKSLWDKIKIPAKFKAPTADTKLSAAQIRKDFIDLNQGLDGHDLAVICTKQRGKNLPADRPLRLSEIRVCFDKDGSYKACTSQVKDRCKGDAQILAVR